MKQATRVLSILLLPMLIALQIAKGEHLLFADADTALSRDSYGTMCGSAPEAWGHINDVRYSMTANFQNVPLTEYAPMRVLDYLVTKPPQPRQHTVIARGGCNVGAPSAIESVAVSDARGLVAISRIYSRGPGKEHPFPEGVIENILSVNEWGVKFRNRDLSHFGTLRGVTINDLASDVVRVLGKPRIAKSTTGSGDFEYLYSYRALNGTVGTWFLTFVITRFTNPERIASDRVTMIKDDFFPPIPRWRNDDLVRGVGDAAPRFSLPTSDGHRVDLAHIAQPIVLDLLFLERTCSPEINKLNALKGYYQKNITIIAVTASKASPNYVRAYSQRCGINYPIALDPSLTVARQYLVGCSTRTEKDFPCFGPVVIFISGDKRVFATEFGNGSWKSPPSLATLITDAANAGARPPSGANPP